ncbi:hypothetical protein [Cytobacillus sp. FSL H8-0458]|uniref:hypothetical protein n=1 Tax=Cytobacillus sp. FSL H8-0458 TaxID=2975346 RepID=UPI0030F8ABAE
MLDAKPVRVGYVQSKFRKDLEKATGFSAIKINEEYAFDAFFRPRKEFFLFKHTGIEDNKTFYTLTARDLLKTELFSYEENNYVYIFNPGADLQHIKIQFQMY